MLNMRIVCGARATPILLCVLGCACACVCVVGVWVYGCVCDTRVEVMLRLHAHSANMGVCVKGSVRRAQQATRIAMCTISLSLSQVSQLARSNREICIHIIYVCVCVVINASVFFFYSTRIRIRSMYFQFSLIYI